MTKSNKMAFAKLHLSIVLAGFTGVFGKLITLPEGVLVWYRLLFSILFFSVLLLVTKGSLPKIDKKGFWKVSKVGLFLSLHWLFFYASIKAANVSVGVICFSLIGFFTALFEPLLLKRPFSVRELIYSLFVLAGVALIFSLDTRYRLGVSFGVISSALAALFTITTKKVTPHYSSKTILYYEMITGFIVITLLMPIYLYLFPVDSAFLVPSGLNLVYLLLFASFCTVGLQYLQIEVLGQISAFTMNLTYNLEPIYSILLAMLLFDEAKELNFSFILGVSLIILSIVLQMRATIHEMNKEKIAI